MGFWEKLSKGLDIAAEGAIKFRALKQIQEWMETEFRDLDAMDSVVQAYVYGRSTDELKAMDEVLRIHIKSNAFHDEILNKTLWIFASFHGAWTLRLYRQQR